MNMFNTRPIVLAVCLTLLAIVTQSVPARQRKVDFHAGSHFRNEVTDEAGDIKGEYGFRSPDGCMHVVRYETKKGKYRVLGTSKRDCNGAAKKHSPPSISKSKKSEAITTKKPITTRRPVTTRKPLTTRQLVTTRKPFATTKRPVTSQKPIPTKRPNLPRKPVTIRRTERPTTAKAPVSTEKTVTTTSTKPTTTTTKRPKKENKPSRSSSNAITGKQLFTVDPPANMKRPKVLSPDDPDPIYSFGFVAQDHGHTQAALPDGTKKGEFFYDSPDGWRRFVTYTAGKNGFYPKLRRERTPGWEDPRNRLPDPENQGKGGKGGKDGKGDGKNGDGGGADAEEEGKGGKQLDPVIPVSNGCPYYFYTNTKINYHWERCLENGTRAGEYGRLADDGYSHKVSYYADARGFRPQVTKTPLTTEQVEAYADFTEGAFIIPKIDEEKTETEKRIQEWISENQNRIDNPL